MNNVVFIIGGVINILTIVLAVIGWGNTVKDNIYLILDNFKNDKAKAYKQMVYLVAAWIIVMIAVGIAIAFVGVSIWWFIKC